MDFLNYGVHIIRRTIPKEILDLAMRKRANFRTVVNIDTIIEREVLINNLGLDMNLARGVEMIIPVSAAEILYQGDDGITLSIPQEATRGRKIISALSLVTNSYQATESDANTALGAMTTMANNVAGTVTGYQTARMELISDFEIHIYETGLLVSDMGIRVVVMYSDRFAEINQRTYLSFNKIFTLAAKAYIYNELIVKLGEGKLYHGHEIGIVKDIIDQYSDAAADYLDEMENLISKVLFMNDSIAMGRYVRSMMPNS